MCICFFSFCISFTVLEIKVAPYTRCAHFVDWVQVFGPVHLAGACFSQIFSMIISGHPLKLHFQIPCVFPVRRQIFPVPIYVICDYYIHKTDLTVKRQHFVGRFSRQISKYLLHLEWESLQLEQTKFPVFSLTGIFFGHFPCFPCAVGTLLYSNGLMDVQQGAYFMKLWTWRVHRINP